MEIWLQKDIYAHMVSLSYVEVDKAYLLRIFWGAWARMKAPEPQDTSKKTHETEKPSVKAP